MIIFFSRELPASRGHRRRLGPCRREPATASFLGDAAFNSGDAKAVAASYAADAELLPPTHTISKGPAEIEKFFDGLIKGGVKGHALKLVEAGGTDKTVYGTANWSATDKDGKQIGGLATHIFERQNDGALKLKAHIFN